MILAQGDRREAYTVYTVVEFSPKRVLEVHR